MAEASRVLDGSAKSGYTTPEERLAMVREMNVGHRNETKETRVTKDAKSSVLGRTLHFKGDLKAEEDLIIQGTVEGSIDHSQSLTIGQHGTMIGDIHARVIVVEGNVEGDLHGTESVSVRTTGRVRGSIYSPSVSLAEGAAFNGRIEMDIEHSARKQTPAAAQPRVAESKADTDPPLAEQDVDQLLGT
jgi:cytoskeletal protein CcmA (bactofilin family)